MSTHNGKKFSVAVMLNGPPGIGKDTIAEHFQKRGVKKLEFKHAIYLETAKYYGVTVDEVKAVAIPRGLKDSPCELFKGLTPRNAMIHVVDEYLKPKFGASVIGDRLVERMNLHNKTYPQRQDVIITDLGFTDEAAIVAQAVDIAIIVQMVHPDFNFDNDSRDYVEIPRVKIIKHERTKDAAQDASRLGDRIEGYLQARMKELS